jgi:3-oxoacyl-[acyl-carrier protein] reductase
VLRTYLDVFGQVPVLVNNAGINRDTRMPKMSLADFEAIIDLSFRGAWLGTRTVSPSMPARGSGSIINMSSLAGKIGKPGNRRTTAPPRPGSWASPKPPPGVGWFGCPRQRDPT